MEGRKDILYIIATVVLLGVIGLYLAFTQGETISSVINIPFRNTPTRTPEDNKQDPLGPPTQHVRVSPTEKVISGGENYFALFETNMGNFEVDLAEGATPNSVKNFSFLVDNKYYDGTSFHRYLPNLLIQGGSRNTLNNDPDDDRYGGPGYVTDDEINWDSLKISEDKRQVLSEEGYNSVENLQSLPIEKYAIAWANSTPNTNGSQFFIVLGDTDNEKVKNLEGRHTVFGKVSKGMEVIDKISKLEVSLDNLDEPRPASEVVVKSIRIDIR